MSDWSLIINVTDANRSGYYSDCLFPMIAGRNTSSQSSLWIWEFIIDQLENMNDELSDQIKFNNGVLVLFYASPSLFHTVSLIN